MINAVIDLKNHGRDREEQSLDVIIDRRLGEAQEKMHGHHDPGLEKLVEELRAQIITPNNIERLRVLTNKNRRYLLEGMSFLLRYAPISKDTSPVNPDVDEALKVTADPDRFFWESSVYAYVRDSLMTGEYQTFVPESVAGQRWLVYMANLFCNGDSRLSCNWFVRLNILYAIENQSDLITVLGDILSDWELACSIPQSRRGDHYRRAFKSAILNLINAGIISTPSAWRVRFLAEIQDDWILQMTELGTFYLNVCVPNFAYVRFVKDSIQWKDTPKWSDRPTRLLLAADTQSGFSKAGNVARTMELLGMYEEDCLRKRVRGGDPYIYSTTFTERQGRCSIIAAVSERMLQRIAEFKKGKVDVSRATKILEATIRRLSSVEKECMKASD